MCRIAVLCFCFLAGCGSDGGPIHPGDPVRCPTGFLCSLEPVAVTGGYSFSAISVGGEHSCAIETTGEAYCWGSNRNGQLGHGGGASFSSVPVEVAGGKTFVKITSGSLHSCALTAQGEAWCWGNGDSGALGTGFLPDTCGTAECSRTPVLVIGGHNFTDIEAGFNHTCAVTAAKAAYCWGSNTSGELGTGSYFEGSSLPELVSGSRQFISVSAGRDFSCAISVDHQAWCWGAAANDVLGVNPSQLCPGSQTLRCTATPLSVETTTLFSQLAAGDRHACGLADDGYVFCWGDNGYGQIGVPGAPRGITPLQVTVSGGVKLSALTVAGDHTCAVTLASSPYCWGRNTSGELGAGSTLITIASPASVAGARTFSAISAGGTELSSHTCALTSDGKAYCWGSREHGQLGDGR